MNAEASQTVVDLAEVPPPSLLFGLLSQRFTGELTVDVGGDPSVVRFRGGMPTWTDLAQDGSRLGELAVAQSLVSRAAVDAAAAKVGGGRRIGEILVADGALAPDKLPLLLRSQCTRRLLELFAIDEGQVVLVAQADPDPSLLAVNVLELIHRGVTARYDMRRLRRDLGSAWSGRFHATAALERYVDQFKFRSEDGSILAYLSGGAAATLAELGGMPDASEARVAQVVAILWHCQMIESTVGATGDFESDLAELEARISAGQDPAAIIGVGGDATFEVLDAAWQRLATRFDPGALDGADPALVARVAEVARVLGEVRVAARERRVALAEIAGLRLIGEAKYQRGLASLTEAISLGAGSPEIDCAVVWARLHTQARGDAELRSADTALAATLAEHPAVALGHYYRGCVLGWLGRTTESAMSLRRALELEPGLVDAQRQLRALSRGERPADAPQPRRKPDDGAPQLGPHTASTHELLTPGYKRLYWFAGIVFVLLLAANFILRLDADF